LEEEIKEDQRRGEMQSRKGELAMTWRQEKAGKSVSGGLLFRYRRLIKVK
jgi:hypothetical protein